MVVAAEMLTDLGDEVGATAIRRPRCHMPSLADWSWGPELQQLSSACCSINVLLYQIVQHDESRRYHEVGYAVFLQSELPPSRSVRARVAG
jgi:hypothetical protein